MKALLPSPYSVSIRSEIDGVDIRRLDEDFWTLPSLPRSVDYIHFSLTEPADFAPKAINVDLTSAGCSFYVTSADDVWVNGTYVKLDKWFSRKRNVWRGIFEKHGLNINGFAILLALTLGPNLDLFSRIVLVLGTVAGAVLFMRVHANVTKLRIHLRQDYSPNALIDMPRLLTTLVGAGFLGAVGWLYSVLSKGGLQSFFSWLAGG